MTIFNIKVTFLNSENGLRVVEKKFSSSEGEKDVVRWLRNDFNVAASQSCLYFDKACQVAMKTGFVFKNLQKKKNKSEKSIDVSLYLKRAICFSKSEVSGKGSPESATIRDGYIQFLRNMKEGNEKTVFKDRTAEVLSNPHILKEVLNIVKNCQNFMPCPSGTSYYEHVNLVTSFLLLDDAAVNVLRNLVTEEQKELISGALPPALECVFPSLFKREGVEDPYLQMLYTKQGYSPFELNILYKLWYDILKAYNKGGSDGIRKHTPGTFSEKDKVKLLHMRLKKGGSSREFAELSRFERSSQNRLMSFIFDDPERDLEGNIKVFKAGEIVDEYIEKLFKVFTPPELCAYTQLFLDETTSHIDKYIDAFDVKCKIVGSCSTPVAAKKEFLSFKTWNGSMRTFLEMEPVLKSISAMSLSYPAGGNAEMQILREENYGNHFDFTSHVFVDRGGQGMIPFFEFNSSEKVSGANASHQLKTNSGQSEEVKRGIALFNSAMSPARSHNERCIGELLSNFKIIEKGLGEHSHQKNRFNRVLKLCAGLQNVGKIVMKLHLVRLINANESSAEILKGIDEFQFFKSKIDVFTITTEKEDNQNYSTIKNFKETREVIRERKMNAIQQIDGFEALLKYCPFKPVKRSAKSPRTPRPRNIFDPSEQKNVRKELFNIPMIGDIVFGYSKNDHSKVVFKGTVKLNHPDRRYDEVHYPSSKAGECVVEIEELKEKRIKRKGNYAAWPNHLLKLESVFLKEQEEEEKKKKKKRNDFMWGNPNSPFDQRGEKKRKGYNSVTEVSYLKNYKNRFEKNHFLKQFGCSVSDVSIRNDGSCQFQCLASALYGSNSPGMTKMVRKRISEWLQQNKIVKIDEDFIDFASFLPGLNEQCSSIDEYSKKILEDDSWGDNLTLQIACNTFHVKIYVVSSKGDLSVFCPFQKKKNEGLKEIILFHEFKNGIEFHYEWCVVVDEEMFLKIKPKFIDLTPKEKKGSVAERPAERMKYHSSCAKRLFLESSLDVDNGVVYDNGVEKITIKMMDDLKEGRMIQDTVYDVMLKELQKEYPNVKFHPLSMTRFMLNSPERAIRRLDAVKFMKEYQIFPLIKHSHACFFYFNNTSGLYMLGFDSLGVGRTKEGSVLCGVLDGILSINHEKIRYRDHPCPHQAPGSLDCVIFCVELAKYLCENDFNLDQILQHKIDGSEKRLYWYDRILSVSKQMQQEMSKDDILNYSFFDSDDETIPDVEIVADDVDDIFEEKGEYIETKNEKSEHESEKEEIQNKSGEGFEQPKEEATRKKREEQEEKEQTKDFEVRNNEEKTKNKKKKEGEEAEKEMKVGEPVVAMNKSNDKDKFSGILKSYEHDSNFVQITVEYHNKKCIFKSSNLQEFKRGCSMALEKSEKKTVLFG